MAFWLGEDIDDFSLYLASLMQKLEMFDDDDINKERAVKNLLHIFLNTYTKVAQSSDEDDAGPLCAHD